MARKPKLTPHIRWMIRRDMPEVLAIEAAASGTAWTEEDFIRELRKRNCIGMVVQNGGKRPGDGPILGFMVYELNNSRLDILNFAVHHNWRRRGVGTALAKKLIGKLSAERRSRITLVLRETNLTAQVFFRSLGFKATTVIRGYYIEDLEVRDGFAFQFRYQPVKQSSATQN